MRIRTGKADLFESEHRSGRVAAFDAHLVARLVVIDLRLKNHRKLVAAVEASPNVRIRLEAEVDKGVTPKWTPWLKFGVLSRVLWTP